MTDHAVRNIYVQNTFMPFELADRLRRSLESVPHNGSDYQAVYPPLYTECASPGDVELFDLTAQRITERIADVFGEAVELETKILVMMRPGSQHTPHADSEYETSPGVWAPNHTPDRAYAGLLYLTRDGVDHVGGVLHVGEDRVVAAEPGRLVMFPATRDYVHWVTPIVSGVRVNMSVWVTRP